MSTTVKDIKALFAELKRAKRQPFPKLRGRMTDVPNEPGVYVIYSPRSKRVVHVGKTSRGTLRQRLRSHLHGRAKYHGRKFRNGYEFQCLPVRSTRKRALLEPMLSVTFALGTSALERCLEKSNAAPLTWRCAWTCHATLDF